jgi:hypothetical protein
MHVRAHVALVGDDGLARVDTHPHGNETRAESGLSLLRRGDRIGGAYEDEEERVALRVHLDAAVLREGPA